MKKLSVENEPHVRSPDGTLFKPDLLIHSSNSHLIVCDVQVCWEGETSLAEAHERKRRIYDNEKFREAIRKSHPGKSLTFEPLTIGARGIWPRCSDEIAESLHLPPNLKASCVHSALKWASSIHNSFGKCVWRRRN